jgi:hypothetical protein
MFKVHMRNIRYSHRNLIASPVPLSSMGFLIIRLAHEKLVDVRSISASVLYDLLVQPHGFSHELGNAIAVAFVLFRKILNLLEESFRLVLMTGSVEKISVLSHFESNICTFKFKVFKFNVNVKNSCNILVTHFIIDG